MNEAELSYESRIQKLEEALTFLEDHVAQQDQEILNLRKKVEKVVTELKDLRQQYDSGSLSTSPGNEKPPHY